MTQDLIKVGDIVTVVPGDRVESFFDCEVLFVPWEAGEPWKLRLKTGDVLFVQNYLYIKKSAETVH